MSSLGSKRDRSKTLQRPKPSVDAVAATPHQQSPLSLVEFSWRSFLSELGSDWRARAEKTLAVLWSPSMPVSSASSEVVSTVHIGGCCFFLLVWVTCGCRSYRRSRVAAAMAAADLATLKHFDQSEVGTTRPDSSLR